jgi:RNA polymerase sigma-70 factor (ECF subfamily)
MDPAPAQQALGFDPTRLIETYQAGVWRYLRALGCEAALAEDLTQDTFLAVMQRPFQEVNPAATSAYLRKTALNMLISHERRAGRVRAVDDVEKLIAPGAGGRATTMVRRGASSPGDCLRRLTDKARQALEMRSRPLAD